MKEYYDFLEVYDLENQIFKPRLPSAFANTGPDLPVRTPTGGILRPPLLVSLFVSYLNSIQTGVAISKDSTNFSSPECSSISKVVMFPES